MLTRRHIRIKVMQSLYSFYSNEENNITNSQKLMFKEIDEIKNLNLLILVLLLDLVKYAESFFKAGVKKFLPTEEDLNPKTRIINNKLTSYLLQNDILISKLKKDIDFWKQNDHNVVGKLFNKLYNSKLYLDYKENTDLSIDVDKKFFATALNQYILNDQLVHHLIEERSIYWVDDLPFIATIIISEIKSDMNFFKNSIFKEKSDREFTLKLFKETIKNNSQYEEIISKFAKNWDLERIAKMDKLLLKMALTEILYMSELPVKVSMNEYIEISKYYSTSKSKVFLNGILDNAVRSLKKEGLINKRGRGLL